MNFWSWGQKPVKYGLANQGATCYLNSVLQVFFMTEDFRDEVTRHNPRTEHIDNELTDLFRDLKRNTAYTHKIIKKLKILNVYEQRDAAEHYEKILRLTSPEASQIFHGELLNRTKCQRCNTQTESEAGFWHLPLPLVDSDKDYSVEKGIEDFFCSSEISGENQMYCEICDEKCDAVLDCEVKHHPEVLVLLLKRFEFDYSYMTYIKINRAVIVPDTILTPQNQSYELYAVVEHFGELRYGHYISKIKSQDDDTWYSFDDSNVSPLSALPKMERSRSAYLLFYRKQKSPVINEISVSPPTEIIKPEEKSTSAFFSEEEDKSVRVVPKRAMSLNESDSADDDDQVKKLKYELSDQAVEPQAGQEYENNPEKNTEGVSDRDRQDLVFSDVCLVQQPHEPDVKMCNSNPQQGNNDWNQPRQSPSEVDDSPEDAQFYDCNSSPMMTKGPGEHVTRGEKVQSSGQEYDSHKLTDAGAYKLSENISDSGTQVYKDCVSGDGSWNYGQSPGVSGAPVNSESVDMKHVPSGDHVNISEEDQSEIKGSIKICALQPEPLSDQNCLCMKNQDKNSCDEENHSDIGAHTLGQTSCKDGCEMVKSESDVAGDTSLSYRDDNSANNDPSIGLNDVTVKRNGSKECYRTVDIEKMDVTGGDHVNIREEDQSKIKGSLEICALQPEPLSDQNCLCVKNQDKNSCDEENHSDIGAHTLGQTSCKDGCEMVKSEGDVAGDTLLSSPDDNSANNDPSIGSPGGEHVNVGHQDQAGLRDGLGISEDGCPSVYGDYMSGPALTIVPANASRQSSMTKDTDVTSECDSIEEGIQGKEKQDDWSHTGAQTLDGLHCLRCKNGCECKGDVAGDTPYRNPDSDNSCPSPNGVPMTRNDSTTTEVYKNDLTDERAAEDQAELREMSVGSEKTAQQPTSDQYEEQQGKVYKAQRQEDQSDVGDLAETKSRGSHELTKNVTDTAETTLDLCCGTANIKDSVQSNIEQTKEEDHERGKSSFVGVSVQGTGKTESEEAPQVKSVENFTTKDNIKDQEKIKLKISDYSQEDNKKQDVQDRKATGHKCQLTKYYLYLYSVEQCRKRCQEHVPKMAQTSNKMEMDRKKDEVKDSQNSATKSREYDQCTSDNSSGENKESPDQRNLTSASWSEESEQKDRLDQSQVHKTKYVKHVIREGDTETIMIRPNSTMTHENNTIGNNPICSHDNKIHESDSLSEGVDDLTLNHPCEVMSDKTVDQCSNTDPQT